MNLIPSQPPAFGSQRRWELVSQTKVLMWSLLRRSMASEPTTSSTSTRWTSMGRKLGPGRFWGLVIGHCHVTIGATPKVLHGLSWDILRNSGPTCLQLMLCQLLECFSQVGYCFLLFFDDCFQIIDFSIIHGRYFINCLKCRWGRYIINPLHGSHSDIQKCWWFLQFTSENRVPNSIYEMISEHFISVVKTFSSFRAYKKSLILSSRFCLHS